ncbi:hypothetical protein [Sphingobium yanoikuyae]|uniref:hypothetical protein n=1 Tax=Sphingobium yanoikuyae TaxID=13690 RepID=UPI003F056C29
MTEDQKDALAQSLADIARLAVEEQAASVLYQAMIIAIGEELLPEQVASVVLETAEDTYANIMANIRMGGVKS